MGLSQIKSHGFRLVEGVIWEKLSDKRRQQICEKLKSLARWAVVPAKGQMTFPSKFYFALCRKMQQDLLRKQPNQLSTDTRYWLDQGWIRP